MEENLDGYSADELSKRCSKNKKQDRLHEAACFELFRRAIVEKDQDSWERIVSHNYHKLVAQWVRQRNPPPRYSVEDYVQEAFARFARSYSPVRFAKAKRLGSVLKFLQSTTFSVVLDAHRRHKRRVTEERWDEEWEQGETINFAASIDFERLMAAVLACCNDERERIVARLTFRNNYMPRHIQAAHPELFEDAEAVSTLKESLFGRLGRCPNLLSIVEN